MPALLGCMSAYGLTVCNLYSDLCRTLKMTALYLEENIYNLLPDPNEKAPLKHRRYVSKFRPSVKREIQEKKTDLCRTMGIPKLQLPTPKDFLQKHSRTPMLPKRKRAPGSKKPAELHVPKRTDHPIMGIRSKKNYISTNITEAIMAVAKKPIHACVDIRKGDKFLIENSGLVIKYRNKKRKMEAQRAQEESESYVRETLRKGGVTQLSKEERESVLEGLKKNWEEINKEFQSLSVVVDTLPRKLRKEKMEVEMKQLEHDINILERNKVIYIKSD
ncbi:hypothetical protein JD844_003870 [Phrynosoma platyrhinos]|uniref:Enkurin domain-containing protein n=1 Tax=Phrynosoma platyrhinos TaxID=52577 RepID=A0ABQ7TDI7_PHRPL|nr:hypothetical protein JD844_003870 [Phrynosoma platyrhinos]